MTVRGFITYSTPLPNRNSVLLIRNFSMAVKPEIRKQGSGAEAGDVEASF
jgi:hypothetical protein